MYRYEACGLRAKESAFLSTKLHRDMIFALSPQPDPNAPVPDTREWGCAQVLVPVIAIILAVVGYRIGMRWGMIGSLIGVVLGLVAAVPVSGILFLVAIGIAIFVEKVSGRG